MTNIDPAGSKHRYRCNFCKDFFEDYYSWSEHWCGGLDREHPTFKEC